MAGRALRAKKAMCSFLCITEAVIEPDAHFQCPGPQESSGVVFEQLVEISVARLGS